MADGDGPRAFRTLRGFIAGQEPDEETYFAYSATLRLSGAIPDLDELTRRLGVRPTHAHRKGDKKGPRSPGFREDMWSYTAPLPEAEPLAAHIDALWATFRGHRDYLLGLKETLALTVFLGYRSNCDHAGVEVPHTSLEMFVALGIPFGVSIIIA